MKICSFLNSSIGLKIVMAVTGLLLSFFLLAHVAGNLLILVSPELFNEYAYTLTSNKLLLFSAEAGLIAIFVAHIIAAVKVTKRNRAARQSRYQVKANSGRSRRTWYSSYMAVSGLFLLVFIIIHLLDFKFGEETMIVQNGVEMRDLASLVIHEFSETGESLFYVVAMLLLATHLLHGVRSAFATTGLEYPKLSKAIRGLVNLFVVAVIGGFITIPVWIYFIGV